MKVPWGGRANLKASRFEGEGAVALIEKEQRPGAANHQQILASAILKVGKQRARGVVEHAHSGLFRYVFKRAVAPIAIEPIRQAGGLTDVQVIETVVVEVASGHSVVAVNVDADRSVENGSPVVGTVQQLRLVRLDSGQRVRRYIDEDRAVGPADRLFAAAHLCAVQVPRFVARPFGASRIRRVLRGCSFAERSPTRS